MENDAVEGAVVKGIVVAIEKDLAIIDVGLKTEGRIALKEFGQAGRDGTIKVGSEVEVYVDRVENALGEAVLSREKARREESWVKLEEMYNENERVEGIIFNQVKGGFTVDLEGAVAFLPRSQVDIRPIRDIGPLMNVPQPFQILKMDKRRGNIVVSRRAILEESRAEQRSEIVQQLEEGQIVDGVVKNITDYGAFVDLGGIDGLLHVTDIAWRRVNHPSEVLSIGETIKVQIIRINHESHRISLGMKQLQADPWEGIEAKYPVGAKFTGRVTNITDYGAFVELEPGIEGLIHVSEMSVDQEERPPRQDRLHVAGSGSDGARGRSRQAPHLAGPQADACQPVGDVRREVSGRRVADRVSPSSMPPAPLRGAYGVLDREPRAVGTAAHGAAGFATPPAPARAPRPMGASGCIEWSQTAQIPAESLRFVTIRGAAAPAAGHTSPDHRPDDY